jgi:predicted Zn-ribbon and HTH transcriptional regulator
MSNPEDEYFAKIEAEKKARLATLLEIDDAEKRAAELKELHYMHCGKCGEEMFTTSFKGVDIEVCPACNSVLLDPGELQQLAGDDRGNVIATLGTLFGFKQD